MEIKEILQQNNFRFNKNLGQNFITDGNLLNAIVSDAGITKDDVVIEIGTGAGTLTRALAKVAKKVHTFEVDANLLPIIETVLAPYDNVEVHLGDVLKMSDEEIKVWVPEQCKVVANLPYYITTPLIMRFIESGIDVISLTLMMQSEVADRIVAKENLPQYGSISVAVQAVADAEITRFIDRRLFYPIPNVDSALVKIIINKNKYDFADFPTFKKVAKSAFLMRRKTLVNNLISVFPLKKIDCENILISLNLSPLVRGEALSVKQLKELSDAIFYYVKGDKR